MRQIDSVIKSVNGDQNPREDGAKGEFWSLSSVPESSLHDVVVPNSRTRGQ
jgi:hypothetical protein